MSSSYEDLLNQQPRSTSAGDTNAARLFVERVNAALIVKGSGLSDAQRNYLYKLRDRWTKRAAGDDLSWNQYGSQPGRRKSPGGPRQTKKHQIDPTVFGDEAEKDPLLSSLERKYGQPRRQDDI